jgi:hypothetical protein
LAEKWSGTNTRNGDFYGFGMIRRDYDEDDVLVIRRRDSVPRCSDVLGPQTATETTV